MFKKILVVVAVLVVLGVIFGRKRPEGTAATPPFPKFLPKPLSAHPFLLLFGRTVQARGRLLPFLCLTAVMLRWPFPKRPLIGSPTFLLQTIRQG